jgi:hypothetical protein
MKNRYIMADSKRLAPQKPRTRTRVVEREIVKNAVKVLDGDGNPMTLKTITHETRGDFDLKAFLETASEKQKREIVEILVTNPHWRKILEEVLAKRGLVMRPVST